QAGPATEARPPAPVASGATPGQPAGVPAAAPPVAAAPAAPVPEARTPVAPAPDTVDTARAAAAPATPDLQGTGSRPRAADPAPTAASADASVATPQPAAAQAAGTPPWEDLPAEPAARSEPAPARPPAAALAVTPPATHSKPALAAVDGPPSWVDEDIPDDAQGGYVPTDEFTADPDDEFETLATGAEPAEIAAVPQPRQRPPARRARQAPAKLNSITAADWPALAARLPVTGLAAELSRQSEWVGVQGDAIVLRVAVKTLAESESRIRLQTVLCEHFGQGLRLEVEVGATGDATAHAVAQAERAARQQAAEAAAAADPFVL